MRKDDVEEVLIANTFYHVGQRVSVSGQQTGLKFCNHTGTIRQIRIRGGRVIGIEFDRNRYDYHTLNGRLMNPNGWVFSGFLIDRKVVTITPIEPIEEDFEKLFV